MHDADPRSQNFPPATHEGADSSVSPGADRSPAPTYAGAFRCIGPLCEDHCCGDWDVPLDRAAYEQYKRFSGARLSSIVAEFVSINPPPQPDGLFAQINRVPGGGCPFFGTDRLCAIQSEYGHGLLSATCSIYPRSLSLVAERLEGSLSLSCPEAARNVLLDTTFLQRTSGLRDGSFRTDNVYTVAPGGCSSREMGLLERVFIDTRQRMIDTVRDRSLTLTQRLLRVGLLCGQIDQPFAAGDIPAMQRLLAGFEQSAELQPLEERSTRLPADSGLRLQMVFALSEAVLQSGGGSRFQNVFWSFVEGIGSPDGLAPGDELGRFAEAERRFLQPFLLQHPYVLENYVHNAMLQHLFPFGRSGAGGLGPKRPWENFLELATHFAWIRGLLIGVSAQQKERFAGEHVVEVVQALTRSTEHYPALLAALNEVVVSRGWASLEGVAGLLGR